MNKILRPTASRQTGFSLIEVLIGAVILATGLLALSALQGSLARNAADARIRSQVAAALESVAEADRGTTSFVSVPAATGTVTVPGLGVLNITVQGCNYRNLTTGENVNTCANKGGTAKQPQYKRIVYSATWTDSVGAARSMTLTSVVSPRTIAGISPLPFSTPTQGVSGQLPIVRTPSPEVPGMIPIAIGDGSDTAATNPKPTIVSGNVVRTSFEVLTYSNEESNIVKQQRRVETAVVGCSCQGGSGPTGAQFERPQWPAYWTGNKYEIYVPTGGATPYGSTETADETTGATQDILCTECCRDHHDATGSTGNVKFDPFRSDAHQHYKLVGSTLTVASGSDAYLEVCRMIRVDGFWRTAQDINSRHFGLLATEANATSAVPSILASSNYETFVINYLQANYSPNGSGQTADSLYLTAGLDEPATINISKPVPLDTRILHARGLYVDNVEPVAQAKIARAAADCTRANPVECILPLLAFTSVNVTEPAFWVSENTSQLTVDSDGVILFNPQSPNRGRVNALQSATPNLVSRITPSIFKSNSGLAVRPRGIDPQDDVAVTDRQDFRVTGISVGTGRSFTVRVTGAYATSNPPVPSWVAGASSQPCVGSSGTFTCNVPSPLDLGPISVAIGRYNYSRLVRAKNQTISCPSPDTRTFSYPGSTANSVQIPQCQNLSVSSVTESTGVLRSATFSLNPVLGLDGLSTDGYVQSNAVRPSAELTRLDYLAIPNAAVVTISLQDQAVSFAPAASCSPAAPAAVSSALPGICP